MKKILLVVCCAAALVSSVVRADALTAGQIADRNVAARGGLEAWRGVTSLTLSGQMEAGGKQDAKLPYVLTMKRPHRSRLELRFQNQTAVQVFDGVQGWKWRPFLGRDEVEDFTPAEIKSAAAASDLDGPLVDYAQKGTRLELKGIERVEGKDAYKIRMTRKDGTVRHVWIDARTFLDVKIEGDPRRLDGRRHDVAVYSRDFRNEGRLMVPHLLETMVEGVNQSHRLTIEKVAVNPKVDDTLFGKSSVNVASAR